MLIWKCNKTKVTPASLIRCWLFLVITWNYKFHIRGYHPAGITYDHSSSKGSSSSLYNKYTKFNGILNNQPHRQVITMADTRYVGTRHRQV